MDISSRLRDEALAPDGVNKLSDCAVVERRRWLLDELRCLRQQSALEPHGCVCRLGSGNALLVVVSDGATPKLSASQSNAVPLTKTGPKKAESTIVPARMPGNQTNARQQSAHHKLVAKPFHW